MNILVDADALVALAKKDDSNHKRVTEISTAIRTATIYTSPFTIPEAATVLSHRVSQKAAMVFLTEMRKQNHTQLPLDLETEALTDSLFVKEETKKGISWADCLNVTLIRLHDLDGIFSFGKFYKRYDISYAS